MRTRLLLLFASITVAEFAIASDSAQVYYQKGLVEKSAKRYLLASNYFEKAISFDSRFVNAYMENAFVNVEMRRTDAAKAAFTKVYELEPGNLTAIQNLTEMYYSYHQYKLAMDFAVKCSNYPQSERIIAMCNYQLENYVVAEKGLLKYLSKNDSDAEATYTLARTYMELEDYKMAMAYYKKAIQLDETRNVWLYELGLICYTSDEYKDAVKYFKEAINKGYPQTNDVSENLGYAYMYSGDLQSGEGMLLDVLSRKPGNKDLLRDMAEVYYKNKMYDKSLDFCQKLLELNRNDGKALWQAGLCFQKKGEKDRGQQMCDKAIEIDPSLAGLRQKSMMSVGL